jgi:two-component system response regulator PilR (NtrC family)
LRKLVATAIKMSEDTSADTSLFGPRLLGKSKVMQDMREMIARVARSQAPVYISGESGTGKELVAKLIHESGPRRDAPFVPVNCGAIPNELMESELFGHKRGSFTGAVSDKKGLIQSAEGGTLFLDEIADLPLHMQVKLLRVIQEKAVRPIGEQQEIGVDVRILSATHKNLSQLVAEGRFREDLFYRVNVIELRVPALRERPEDVPELAEAVLRRLARRMKIAPPTLAKSSLLALESYSFPGNVRELENILERAITLSTNGEVNAHDIQLRPTPLVQTLGQHAPAQPMAGQSAPGLGDHLEDIERDAILKALELTRHNKTAAAKALGMSFRALRYRIKKLGIE